MFETYFFLFVDSFFASLILPIRSEMALKAMVIFGKYNQYLIFTVAVFASVIGLFINYFIGKYLAFIKRTNLFKDNQEQLTKITNFWNKYIIWFLPIAVFNVFGTVISLFCGFFQTKIKYFLLMVLFGKIAYYAIFIF